MTRAPISNWLAGTRLNRWLMDAVVGIDRRRPLPRFARESFTDWFDARRPNVDAPRGSVVLFHDTFNTYNTPEIARAAVELLEGAGYRIELVGRKCCVRPMISKGMLDEARANAEWNVRLLAPWVERGVPVVGLERSCLLTLRDEYVDLLRTDAARAVYTVLRVIDNLKVILAPFLPHTAQQLHEYLGHDGRLFGDLNIVDYQESTRAHKGLVYDKADAIGTWSKSTLQPGQPLREPQARSGRSPPSLEPSSKKRRTSPRRSCPTSSPRRSSSRRTRSRACSSSARSRSGSSSSPSCSTPRGGR